MHLPHHTYVSKAVKELRSFSKCNPSVSQRLLHLQQQALTLALLDLEPARELLDSLYAPKHHGSQKPRDAVSMLRCFLLMALLGFTSINKWAAHLKGHPELLILSGFPPSKPPGVGTFYDFIHRLLDGPYQRPCPHNPRPSRRFRGVRNRFRRQLQEEKALRAEEFEEPNEGKVKQAVELSLARIEHCLPEDFTKRINELLMVCAVVPSAESGVLGDLSQLSLAGDGSALPSQANGHGRPLCQCHKNGDTKCGCDRLYADPQATWGWDSYREKYYFGYRLHSMCGAFNGRDLPLHLSIDGAHRSDVLMGVDATERVFKQLRKQLAKARLKHGIFDAGYDATAFYKMWLKLEATPVIALNRSHVPGTDPDGLERGPSGIPLCPGGIEFKRHGLNRKQQKVVYYCPAKYMGRTKGKQHFKVDLKRCPLGVLCEPESTMGPLVNLFFDGNPRMNVEIPRDSEKFKELFKQRTSCERFFARLERKGVKNGCYRRKHLFLFRVMCEAVVAHAQAWVKAQFGESQASDVWELLEWMERAAHDK